MTCPNCGAELAENTVYCPTCGTFQGVTQCPTCGADVTQGTAFCTACGAALPKASQPTEPVVARPAAVQPAAAQPVAQPVQQPQQPTIIINNTNTNQATPAANASIEAMTSPKNRWVALALCFFFGGLGVHRFYVGKIGTGILYLLTVGLGGIGWTIDFFTILFGSFRDKYGFWLRR